MIGEAKALGLEVALNTNGLRLGELAGELCFLGLDELIVSLKASKPELYDEFRAVGELGRLREGLEALRGRKIGLSLPSRSSFST